MTRADQPIFSNSFPKTSTIESIPVREDILYANKNGEEKPRLRAPAAERMKKLAPALARLLKKDEVIMYTASANAPMGALETYTLGTWARNTSRVTLVFTQERILALRVDRHGNWRESVRGCAYADLMPIKIDGWINRYLHLKFTTGKKANYWGLGRTEANALKKILPVLQQAAVGQVGGKSDMVSLCPACSAELAPQVYECANCHQMFRNEESLWWRALIPGGVYFYANQGGLGVLHAIVDSLLTLDLLVSGTGLLAGMLNGSLSGENLSDTKAAVAYIFVVTALEKLVAVYHARRFIREFIPIPGTSQLPNPQFIGVGAGSLI